MASDLRVDMMGAARASRKVTGMEGTWRVPAYRVTSGTHAYQLQDKRRPFCRSALAYGAIKAAMISHSKSMASTLAHQRIRVNTVVPGPIEWPNGGWDIVKKTLPTAYKQALEAIPSRRLGAPEEVANAVLFLASEKASWITDTVLNVDGAQYPGIL